MRAFQRVIPALRVSRLSRDLLQEGQHVRYVHSSYTKAAVAHPVNVSGPPPQAPAGSPLKEKRTAIKQEAGSVSSSRASKPSPLRKRFWKDVHVKEAAGGHQIYLDSRPVRTPEKKILTVPASKPHVAHAIALEWDLLKTAQHATKYHLIPMTSLTGRAEDIADEDSRGVTTIRDEITRVMLRYLETDTLLSWAPEKEPEYVGRSEEKRETLREKQIKTAQPIITSLVSTAWPGVELKPTLDANSIMPLPQSQETLDVIRGWLSTLSPYDLAGVERAGIATKSLLVGARVVIEWSENFRHLRPSNASRTFGIEEAAHASSLEVRWQTENWGEVEDTHDVEKEDLRRQLGSVILLVSGRR
ncbi:ATP synthase mitochondrial F1 complex assembly factor 2 [Microsporum audouinii]